MSTHDEEALQWAGDNDERLSESASPKTPRARRGASVVSAGKPTSLSAVAGSDSTGDDELDNEPRGLSSLDLIAFGILAGVYLLFSVAWLITVLRNPTQFEDAFSNFMFVSGLWLAVAAPAAWFGTVLYLGRNSAPWVRLVFLVVGAAVVIPWPFITWAG